MKKLFIVDDDEDILISLNYWFTKRGYEVMIFFDSKTLLPALAKGPPDLLLLDVNLKGEDGRDICKHIKINFKPTFPIILFSANPNVAEHHKDYCADAFVEKPFDLIGITKKIERYISGSQLLP